LRRARNRHQVRIIWRDLTRQADLVQTCRDLSDMADATIDQAYQWLYPRHCQQFGTPTGDQWPAAANGGPGHGQARCGGAQPVVGHRPDSPSPKAAKPKA
jgi:hypothetical protein